MWDKDFRLSIFAAVYEHLFNGEANNEPAWDLIFYSLKLEDPNNLDRSNLSETYQKFLNHADAFELELKKYLKDWNKTFYIVKASLYTCLLEMDQDIDFSPDLVSEITTRYIRITEDFIGGQNVGLVHAVISKIKKDI